MNIEIVYVTTILSSYHDIVDKNITILNKNKNLIATVSYSLTDNEKIIRFYNNKSLAKIFKNSIEKEISDLDTRLMGILDKFLSHTID